MTNLIEPSDPNVGRTIGGFFVERMLSAGGMGTVYLARQELTKRPTALKLIHPHLVNREMLGRFQQEAVAVSRLIHPNIVTVFSYGQDDQGSLYIAMEYLDGRTLADTLNDEGPFAPARALPLMIQLAEALACAHEQSVVHRDIKPENIMCTRFGRKEGVKVLDFGIAKILDDETVRTKTGAFVGSPPFMSPEQWRQDRTIDGRTDIYSLGCVFYLMLVGELPFKGSTTLTFMKAHLNERPTEPVEIIPEIAEVPGLDRIVMRCLERERENRFPDAYHLAEALSELRIAGQPASLLAHPAPPRSNGPRSGSPSQNGELGLQPTGKALSASDFRFDTPTEAATLAAVPGAREEEGPTLQATPEQARILASELVAANDGDSSELEALRRSPRWLWLVLALLIPAAIVAIWRPWETNGTNTTPERSGVTRPLEAAPKPGTKRPSDPSENLPKPNQPGTPTKTDPVVAKGTKPPTSKGPGSKLPNKLGDEKGSPGFDPTSKGPGDRRPQPTSTGPQPKPKNVVPKLKSVGPKPKRVVPEPKSKVDAPAPRQAPKVLSIIVISKPGGARLYIDGVDNGETPALLSLSESKARTTLLLKLDGYHELSRTVNFELARLLKGKRLVLTLKKRGTRKKPRKDPGVW